VDLKELIKQLQLVDAEADRIGLKDVQVWAGAEKDGRRIPLYAVVKSIALWPTLRAVDITIGRPE
jgi:hypothetical protein